MVKQKQDLLHVYRAAVQAVDGRACVRNYLYKHPLTEDVALIAIGKAAVSMANGAYDALKGHIKSGIVITKEGYTANLDAPFSCYRSSHPILDEDSLSAGDALLTFIEQIPPQTHVLFLISGGTSALVEVLKPSVTLAQAQKLNRYLLSNDYPIDKMNALRTLYSDIKGGGLLKYLTDRRVTQLLLSDVPCNSPHVIGSGLLSMEQAHPNIEPLPTEFRDMLTSREFSGNAVDQVLVDTRVLGSVQDAIHSAVSVARELGYIAHSHEEPIIGDINSAAENLCAKIETAPLGLHVWGAEVTLELPESPGLGGRCQHLGLLLAKCFAGKKDLFALIAKTDGHDGATHNAGALIDGSTLANGLSKGLDPDDFIKRADSTTFLAATENILTLGPTGTKVLDLVLILKGTSNESILARV